jgi:hypothetical protein
MLQVLTPDAREAIARALQAKLNAPPTAAERRVRELSFLTELMDEQPQNPDRPAYIPRKLYDRRLAQIPNEAVTSARLQDRYGSWARACHAAWGLLHDGRSWGRAQPWPRPPRCAKNYDRDEAIASVRAAAGAIGHLPSSSEYHAWVLNRRARARACGASTRPYVHYASLMRLLAPDRSGGNGWRLVLRRVLDDTNGVRPRTARHEAVSPRAAS